MAALQKDYRREAQKHTSIRVVIVGESPYPNRPTGIPFMKSSWEEMFNPTCCGQYVLQSILGKCIHSLVASLNGEYRTPGAYARRYLLAEHGVVFLNATYSLPEKPTGVQGADAPSEDSMMTELKNRDWTAVNKRIFEKITEHNQPQVVLCGDLAQRMYNQIRQLPKAKDLRYERVIHPSTNNTLTDEDFEKWEAVWGVGRLRRLLGLCID